MTDLANVNVSPFDAIRRTDEGGEYWTGRDLMAAVGYDKWERFEDAIERAIAAATNADRPEAFSRTREEGTGGRPRTDYRMSRYGAYLLVMNGDPRKPKIASAQSYFAVKTREAEVGTSAPPLAIPATYAEALRAAADQAERADAAEAKVAELEPKAEMADTFLISDGSSRLVGQVAKLLGVKEGQLRRFLLDEKLIFVRHAPCGIAQYEHYAAYAHHFVAKEVPVQHSFGTCSHFTLRITARGVELVQKRMRDANGDQAAITGGAA